MIIFTASKSKRTVTHCHNTDRNGIPGIFQIEVLGKEEKGMGTFISGHRV